MRSFTVGLSRALGAVALVATSLVIHPTAALAATTTTCTGGSVAAGTYGTLIIAGQCAIDSGNVTVTGALTVQAGAVLNAAFGGSDLTVGNNVVVLKGAILILGCEPEAFTCFNDPDQMVGTFSTHDVVHGSISAAGALMMLLHHNTITGNVVDTGGGGGVTCSVFPLGPDGPPAYSTFEDNYIGGNASIFGLQTCWLGFIRNNVGTVNFSNNVTADPDGNEVTTNTVRSNLVCLGNSPAAQFGDSQGSANQVGGLTVGQCVDLGPPS